jgi:hypothetical protein
LRLSSSEFAAAPRVQLSEPISVTALSITIGLFVGDPSLIVYPEPAH